MLVAGVTLALGLVGGYELGSEAGATGHPAPGSSSEPVTTAASLPPTTAAVLLPTYIDLVVPSLGADLPGRLEVDGPCLFLLGDAGNRWLPIWPAGEAYRVDGGILSGQAGAFRIGALVTLTGTAFAGVAPGSVQALGPVAPACAAAEWWLVTGVHQVSSTG